VADVRLRFSGESRGATDATKSVEDALEDLSRQALETRAVLSQALKGIEGASAEREIKGVEDELGDLQRKAVETRATTSGMFDGIDSNQAEKALLKVTAGIGGVIAAKGLLGSALGDFKQPAMWAGFGLGVQAIGALSAAAIALVSALAPASGALVAYPAILGAFVQGMLAAKIGLGGLGDAFKAAGKDGEDFEKAVAKLPPQMQAFARMLHSDVIPAIHDLRDDMQKPILDALTTEIHRAFATGGIFDVFRKGMLGTSDVMAGLIHAAGDLAASPAFQERFGAIMAQNNTTLDRMGHAILSIVDALTHVLVAAGPFIDWLTKGIQAFAEWTDRAAAAGQESGRLAGFFDKTRETLTLLWNVLKPLGVTFLEIGKAAAPLGREILRDLANEADRLAAWATSEGGRETMRRYFENAKPLVYEVGRLLRDVTGALLDLSNVGAGQNGLVDFVRRIRTEVLPIFQETAKGSAAAFGPVLQDAIINLLKLFAELGGPNGPLVVLARTIGTVAGAFASLLSEHPAIKELVLTLTGILTWSKLLAATGIIGFLVNLAGGLLAMVAPTAAANLGFQGLNATMRANPIGAIITAIQLLVAAFIVAYTRSETFRNIVNGLWEVFKSLLNPIGLVVQAIGSLGGVVTSATGAFSSLLGWIRSNWPIVATLIAGPFAPIVALATNAFGIRSALVGALGGIIDWVRSNWRIIATVISGPFAPLVALATDAFGIRSALTRALGGISSTALAIGNAVRNGVTRGITGVGSFVSSTISGIGRLLSSAVASLGNTAARIGYAIRAGVARGINGIGSFVSSTLAGLGSLVTGYITRLGNAAYSLGRGIYNGLGRGLSGLATLAWGLIKAVPNALFRALNAIRIPAVSITIPVPFAPDISFRTPTIDPIPNIPYLAKGGIVTAPTLAVIGERGPEAVIPLDRGGLGGDVYMTLHVAGSVIAERDLVRSMRDGLVGLLRDNPGALRPGLARG
jgi:hypothetical protein